MPEALDYLEQYDYHVQLCSDDPQKEPLAKKVVKPLRPIWEVRQEVANSLAKIGFDELAERVQSCGTMSVPFTDDRGHMTFKRTFCGVPSCPTCSRPKSGYNKRRAASLKESLLGYGTLGRVIFTISKEDSKNLSLSAPVSLTSFLKPPQIVPHGEKKKRQRKRKLGHMDPRITQLYDLAGKICHEYFDAPLVYSCLHYFGDKKPGLHLHVESVFPSPYNGKDNRRLLWVLNQARAAWTKGVNEIFKKQYPTTNIKYRYATTPSRQHHFISYMTRSTLWPEKFLGLTDDQKKYVIELSLHRLIRESVYITDEQQKAAPPLVVVGKKTTQKSRIAQLKYYRRTARANKERFVRWNKIELHKPPPDLIAQGICLVCKVKMKAGRPIYIDDMPLSQLYKVDNDTWIDLEQYAVMREEEKANAPPYYDPDLSLLERLLLDEERKNDEVNGREDRFSQGPCRPGVF